MIFELVRRYRFEAAHWLPNVPAGHQCSRVHGHTYSVEIAVRGPLDQAAGWVMDYAAIDDAVAPVIKLLDHRCLNDVDGLSNPTSEQLTRWLWMRVRDDLPGLSAITVAENLDVACTYRREDPCA